MVLVQLSLHAVKLKNVAGALKGTSDPFAVVTKIATSPGQKAEVLGKTEVYVILCCLVYLTCTNSTFFLDPLASKTL